MSVVLTRRLFNGNNKPSSKNNGIVSGFDDDNDSELQQLINERKKVYQSIVNFRNASIKRSEISEKKFLDSRSKYIKYE